jgi:hypothetical protein
MKYILAISLILIGQHIAILQEPYNNQLTAFPNTNQPPTNSTQLPLFNYTAPSLSLSLYETNPNRKFRLIDFLETVNFPMYKLSKGEAEQIFTFSDKNKNDLLEQSEWEGFASLFVFPFEACDKSGDYLLSEEEFRDCYEADPSSKVIRFRNKYETMKYSELMSSASVKGKNVINFFEYLFIRRAMFGWKECHSDPKYINQLTFNCAIQTVIPNKYLTKLDLLKIYKVGLKLSNEPGVSELDFLSYTRVLFYTYMFSILGEPSDTMVVDKYQFLKNVKDGRAQVWLSDNDVNLLYGLISMNPKGSPMNFETFCFFFNIHRLFMKYSTTKDQLINQEELMRLLNDTSMPYAIVKSIDTALTGFEEKDYQEVTMVLQRMRLNEKDYYYSFLEQNVISPVTGIPQSPGNFSLYELPINTKSREAFFTIHCGFDKVFWDKSIFFRAFLWANLYTELKEDNKYLLPVSRILTNLPNTYEIANPPIGQLFREDYSIFKNFPQDLSMDILAFSTLENYIYKFQLHQVNKDELVNETVLKIILKDYGMINMPDTVIDLAKKGSDSLRRRMYKVSEVIKDVLIVQVACADNLRNKWFVTTFGLKLNDEISRRFPGIPRRFKASPLV